MPGRGARAALFAWHVPVAYRPRMPDKQMAISRAWRDSGSGRVRPTMLAIAGDSAAGKTTLTRGLTRALGPERITAICVDDYHSYDRVERRSLPFTPLDPRCNYVEIMEQHLQLLALGQPILKPVYNHSQGTLERPVLVETEGVRHRRGAVAVALAASRGLV